MCVDWRYVRGLAVCAWIGGMCVDWRYVRGLAVCAWIGGMCVDWRYVRGLAVCAWIGGMCVDWRYVRAEQRHVTSHQRAGGMRVCGDLSGLLDQDGDDDGDDWMMMIG
ncbi:hypothetical protein PAPYR_5806 [Paratrimastix pyriformis]|uniref:Uncharacterized protein n=1 Tax=Paratrimastix pyriformis TaxID=342808 RepID=A0ABQ8UJL8_9EUKA|nr:hypothetical protein PAPYR_5806 [Paratrimastix pyriformis]